MFSFFTIDDQMFVAHKDLYPPKIVIADNKSKLYPRLAYTKKVYRFLFEATIKGLEKKV